ncbi:MAG: ATPase [Lachnospiraceae bacterium]|nr:ATPase [Lachnospiraceae bacterium]
MEVVMSKYEQTLAEIEEFLDNCKRQKLSGTNIIVNKEQMEEYISELRMKTPEEIKKYQRIISNRDAILNAAQAQAEELLENARQETTELISEHEIMQQAYVQAQSLVDDASEQAQQILDSAVNDANDIRMGAMQYTDDILANLQNIITHTMENVSMKYDNFMKSLNTSLEVVTANRNELVPQEEPEASESRENPEEEKTQGVIPDTEFEDYTVDLS